MQNDSIKKIIMVSVGVCLVCSIFVCSAAVFLKPLQTQNKKLDKIKNILVAGDLMQEGIDPEKIFNEKIEAAIIEVATGETFPKEKYDDVLNIAKYEIKDIADNEKYGMDIPKDEDTPAIGRMPKFMLIYMVKDASGTVEKYILPIYGKGLWSTMYGFIAMDKDLMTVRGFTFYDHGETPGLGGEVDNQKWKNSWKGKTAINENGEVVIHVIKGQVNQEKPEAISQIDGLSGSTLTTRGIDNLVKFWLGENGYAKFFAKLRKDGSNG
ncbi:MAG: Na(+)-translocating NADH-quinone reductase subunit C [Candidatus Kapabacteria bacterium]|jgi:Na+-transporting NADH:ubiquinone oxidoreductase subunit C|nr:Na(+)-translocating NADH-quinone reductase subunit C [Candidatus Kapabacteria bacterium]